MLNQELISRKKIKLTEKNKTNLRICSGVLLAFGMIIYYPLVLLIESSWGGLLAGLYFIPGLLGFYASYKEDAASIIILKAALVFITILNSLAVITIIVMDILVATVLWDYFSITSGIFIFILVASAIVLVLPVGIVALSTSSLIFLRELKQDIE